MPIFRDTNISWGKWLGVYRNAGRSALSEVHDEPERSIAPAQLNRRVACRFAQFRLERSRYVFVFDYFHARVDRDGIDRLALVKHENKILCLEVRYAIPEGLKKAVVHERMDTGFRLFLLRLTFHLCWPPEACKGE